MPTDKELEQTAAQLASFRTASEQHHATLTEVTEKYSALMDDYKRLRSDYEEERDSRERYKQMARGQERNPFVLVLIDGDGYIFDDDLVSKGADGGQEAARLLNDVVKRSLRSRGLDHCRVMVRVYANLAGLSKTLSKAKLAGPEKRSLAPFTASFTRSNDLFDFVDAGELKENADFKIRALFRQFVENVQCRHIYFAGCHDSGYLGELEQYHGNRDRITLVRNHAFHHEFTKLGMRVEDFPNIFRTLPLDEQPYARPSFTRAAEPPALPAASPADNSASICAFFQKGICKYGRGCKFLHVKASANGHSASAEHAGTTLSDIRSWRQSSSGEQSNVPFQLSHLAKNDNEFMSGNTYDTVVAIKQTQTNFATSLPHSESIPRNQVPVNKHQHRLDAYIPNPPPEERAAFTSRCAVRKLCNNHHILGNCPNTHNCEYDHSAASPAILNCLEQVVRNSPCPRRGTCRNIACLHGHICQKAECRYRGGKLFCKIPAASHDEDLNVVEFVPGFAPRGGSDETQSLGGRSGSTPPRAGSRTLVDDSDNEPERGEGASLGLTDNDVAPPF